MAEPKLVATFETNDAGEPLFERDVDDLKHYRIALKVEDAPEDVYAATFELDPTYYDPVRTVSPKDGSFVLKTTSYGDYVVTVRLRSKEKGMPSLKASLAQALRASYRGEKTMALRAALEDIADN